MTQQDSKEADDLLLPKQCSPSLCVGIISFLLIETESFGQADANDCIPDIKVPESMKAESQAWKASLQDSS